MLTSAKGNPAGKPGAHRTRGLRLRGAQAGREVPGHPLELGNLDLAAEALAFGVLSRDGKPAAEDLGELEIEENLGGNFAHSGAVCLHECLVIRRSAPVFPEFFSGHGQNPRISKVGQKAANIVGDWPPILSQQVEASHCVLRDEDVGRGEIVMHNGMIQLEISQICGEFFPGFQMLVQVWRVREEVLVHR